MLKPLAKGHSSNWAVPSSRTLLFSELLLWFFYVIIFVYVLLRQKVDVAD